MNQEKSDAQRFRNRISQLKQETWLTPPRRWWADFLFHHTNITNVVDILKTGVLSSRAELRAQGDNFKDSGSPNVLEQTDEQWKKYVRFYFRPRTPTFFHVEGIRPQGRQSLKAHCPVPVYLLFDLLGIICRPDSSFSNGNLAKSSLLKVSNKAEHFEQLPFQLIYHDSGMPEEQKRAITFHRNAEVIVPKQIRLEHLKRIWCRSKAEYNTLRYLLGDSLWQQWGDKITDRTDHYLFRRQWVHIVNANLNSQQIIFTVQVPQDTQDSGPFNVILNVLEIRSGLTYTSNMPARYITKPSIVFELVNLKFPNHYTVELLIDGNLAFAGEYLQELEDNDIPF